MYAYYQNGVRNVDAAEKELLYSLMKAHDLYNYLLLLIVEVTRYADEVINDLEAKNKVAHIDTPIDHRFIENRFVKQLDSNIQLTNFVDNKKMTWFDERDFLKKLYAIITESEYYAEYMAKEKVEYIDDRERWRKLYKNIIMKDESIDDLLEDKCLYWNDDKQIVDTFVLKSIKRFEEANGKEQELMPEFKDDEDREFAIKLLRKSIINDEYYQSLISGSSRKWDFSRLAFMDIIIMQVAIAEMLIFPEIPVTVTINEYIEIARCYSTPKSPSYVNGIIDHIAKQLIKENKLMKVY